MYMYTYSYTLVFQCVLFTSASPEGPARRTIRVCLIITNITLVILLLLLLIIIIILMILIMILIVILILIVIVMMIICLMLNIMSYE